MPTRRNLSFDPATTIDVPPSLVSPPPTDRRPSPSGPRRPPEVGGGRRPGHRRPDRPPSSTKSPSPARSTEPITAESRISGLVGVTLLVLVMVGLGLPLPGGHLAADAVLVVIGFQLGLAMTREADRGGRWIRRFWLRTLAPIAVPSAVAVALAAGSWWWLDRLGSDEIIGAVTSVALVSNLSPIVTDAHFPATGHLWLVAVVAQFVLLAPLVVRARRRRDGAEFVLRTLIVAIAMTITARLTVATTGLDGSEIRALAMVTRIDGLLIGLAVALAPATLLDRIPGRLAVPAILSLPLVFLLAPDAAELPVVTLGVLAPAVALATAVVVATRHRNDPDDALSRVLGYLGPRWLGSRAMSIYVWHQVFGMAVADGVDPGLFGTDWPGWTLFGSALVFALAAGAASYRYLQLPIRAAVGRLGRRRAPRPEHRLGGPRADAAAGPPEPTPLPAG